MAIVLARPPTWAPVGAQTSKSVSSLVTPISENFYMYVCFTCFHGCAPHMCLVPAEARRGIGSPGAAVTVVVPAMLGMKPGASGKAPSALSMDQPPASTYTVRQGFPREPRAADWARVAGQHVPVIPPPPPKFQDSSAVYSSPWCRRRAGARQAQGGCDCRG